MGMSHDPEESEQEPMADAELAALGLRMLMRRAIGVVLLVALLVVVIRGIYVVWQVQQSGVS